MSIASLEEGFVINKDGSLSIGFEAMLFEEEELSPDKFISMLTEFSAAAKQLPIGTTIQKLDIYWEDTYTVNIPSEVPFFQKKNVDASWWEEGFKTYLPPISTFC